MPESHQAVPSDLNVAEDRSFRAYHDFLRASRNFMAGPLVSAMHSAYEAEVSAKDAPAAPEAVGPILDELLEFQVYSWANRHLQRFKYHRPDFGIFSVIEAQREALLACLDCAGAPSEELRLNPDLKLPDYYTAVDFHQHTGGVWSDELDGVAYEFGRRTTNATKEDPDVVYRLSYSQFPEGTYPRVLDWGTGHGAGLIEWQKLHPESECYGVDLSAPCLKLAHKRAREHGFKMHFSQQDVEHLDFEDNFFDLVFHLFMFHEIAPRNLKAALQEVHRILKPGGVFVGPEIHVPDDNPFMNALWTSHAWSNNEPYSAQWFKFDMEQAAKDIGFSKVSITPFVPYSGSETRAESCRWRFYTLEK